MIPVTVFVNDIQVGSGELNYTDMASWGLWNKTETRCMPQDLCIDNNCYSNAVEFCYPDKVTDWLPGAQQVTINIPVHIDDIVAGEAQVTYTDSYSMNILVPLALIALTLYIVSRSVKRVS
jgi:hypothetical protein